MHYSHLIVDDTQVNRYIISRYLQKYNSKFHIDEASNGEDALEKVKNNNYDLIFMDIRMPGKYNGIETCQIIKKENPNQIVIGFTGQIEINNLKIFDKMLEKPIGRVDINKLLDSYYKPNTSLN